MKADLVAEAEQRLSAPPPPEPPASDRVTVVEGGKGGLGLALRDLWKFRELLYFLVWRDVKVRYKQTAIGALWAILQPFMTMLVFSLIFGRLAGLGPKGVPYPVFVYSALLPWQLFTTALNQAGNSIVMNQQLVTKVYFPRLLIPIGSTLAGVVDFGLAFTILLGMMVYYGIAPSLALLALPAFVVLAVATALAVGLWLSALNVQFRDVQYTIPFLVQFWFFVTPIVYSPSTLPHWAQVIFALNPMTGVVEAFRWALLGQTTTIGPLLFVSLAMVVALLFGGARYFRRMERTFADLV